MAEIHIFPGKKELRIPLIKLTKSVSGKTGTATFFFLQPFSFSECLVPGNEIKKVSLIERNKEISTEHIRVLFQEGKPTALKAIFLLKNSKDWFEFLSFMTLYSKENGFLFQSENLEKF
jgi:photosystem II protein